jgi:hypothetical protein
MIFAKQLKLFSKTKGKILKPATRNCTEKDDKYIAAEAVVPSACRTGVTEAG